VPPPLVCHPLIFAESLSQRLHLLSRYCTPLVQLVVAQWPPFASQPAPPPLFMPLHLLVVASHCVTLSGALAFPPPLIMPLPLVAPLLFGWLLGHVAWHPGLSPPPIAVLEMPLSLSLTSLPSVAAVASSPTPSPSPSLSPPLLSLLSLSTLKGERGGGGF
jgi:hypothetical protein